ncbi:MAG TPA: trimeric intracellular cation channel family protein [Candidatus Limnocylindria bacterium]|jgi:uncharacterized membrane protein YeiH|nr:trimeric intracellular cation channel family protein [Candidatus Limnocylindria bacterium]
MPTITFQFLLEHLGIAVSATTGVLAARGRRIDLFGVLVLALVTSFGGGTIRDLLVGDLPVAWLREPSYLINASLTAMIVFFLARKRRFASRSLVWADACALALFVVIGTRKGLSLNFSPTVCVLLGVTTGVVGGILRDVLTREVPLVFQPEIRLYATAALVGAAVQVSLHYLGIADSIAGLSGGAVVLAMRVAGIFWRLALPEFESDTPHP